MVWLSNALHGQNVDQGNFILEGHTHANIDCAISYLRENLL